MRFSIRQLLALMFLTGLALLAWRTRRDEEIARAGLAQAKGEVKSLEIMAAIDTPARHQTLLHVSDEASALRQMRERSLQHFDQLREKYRQLESRGPDVLSFRSLPVLAGESDPAPVHYRMLVPEDWPIWLHFGVFSVEQDQHSSSRPPDKMPLSNSPFTTSGPFERKLPAGDHLLSIAVGSAKVGSIPVEIKLDDTLLLRTNYESENVTGSGWSRISATSQTDYRRSSGDLPVLLTATPSERSGAGREDRQTHRFSLWLSDQSRDFAPFPGK